MNTLWVLEHCPWIATPISQYETIIFGGNGNGESADAWSYPKSWLQEKNERSNERMLPLSLSLFSSYGITHPYTHPHPPSTTVGRLFLSRRSLSTEQAGVEKEDVQTTQRKLRWGVDVAESRRMFVLWGGQGRLENRWRGSADSSPARIANGWFCEERKGKEKEGGAEKRDAKWAKRQYRISR